MRRAVPGRMGLNLVALMSMLLVGATAGCQMTGARALEEPGDLLIVDRFYSAKFDSLKGAVEDVMHDQGFMEKVAGFDYSQGVTTTSWSFKGAIHKVAHRDMESAGHTLYVKVDQRDQGCVVTARVSTGDANKDPGKAVAFLDRIGEAVGVAKAPGSAAAPATGGEAAPLSAAAPAEGAAPKR